MSNAVLIDLHGTPWSRLRPKLREETGFGLIELLISLLVLNVGIFATMGAFTSGAVAIRNASRVSTAAAVADRYMECFRDAPYASIRWPMTSGSCTATTVTGADGRSYSVSATVTAGSQLTTGTYTGSTAVKAVTLTVTDVATSKLLMTTSSTFSQCAQDMTTAACGGS